MPRDELRQPLRQRRLAERLWARRPGALATASVLTAAGFLAGGVWLARLPYPFAGEPIVVATIPPLQDIATSSTARMTVEPEADPGEAAAEDLPEELPAAAADETNIIVAQRRPLRPAPVAAVTETADIGKLPKIGPNGKKPADVYAQATPIGVLHSERPKIAILLGGMGLNQTLTQKAIKDLPGDVTFAFAPYGEDLQTQVNRARANGHEVMLQVPMEPLGYPGANPGPHTLLADASEAVNRESLLWHMSRFSGYTGITNYMGGRFLSSPATLQPVLAEMKKRGLLFFEDASVGTSSTAGVAKAVGLSSNAADVPIDAEPDAASIDAALAQLEAKARADGMAVGTGAGLDITITAVARWAKDLERRGYVLVPISATYRGRLG